MKGSKVCTKCKIEKNIMFFSYRRKSQGIRRAQCKECDKKERKEHWGKSGKDVRKIWIKNNPEKVKEHRRKTKEKHKEKYAIKQKEWRLKNKEHISKRDREKRNNRSDEDRKIEAAKRAEYNKKNQHLRRIAQNKRRALKAQSQGEISKDFISKLFALQKGKCVCCKQPLGADYHIDHIMPLALGGQNTEDNIQLLRAVCNMQKGSKHPFDFMQSRGFLF